MYKIVTVVDKVGSALDRLAKGTQYPGYEHTVVDVHPKRPTDGQLDKFVKHARFATVIDFQYWKTAEMLRERYTWLEDKMRILTHQNPYNLKESDWNDHHIVVGNNLEIYGKLKDITDRPVEHIPITVDPEFWAYNRDWKPTDQIIMVAARIEGKKGVLPVAQAVKKAGLKLLLVGSVSEPDYMDMVMDTGVVEFREKISDEDLRQAYYDSLAHICNSVDNFESGTMPILESMCCGTPVVTREIGHVPDLNNGSNLIINKNQADDVEGLTKILKSLKNKDLQKIRDKAWNSAKNHSFNRRAYMYQRLFRNLQGDSQPVSIVMPIYDKDDITWETVKAIMQQDYDNLELVMVNDNPESNHSELLNKIQNTINIPFNYIDDPLEGYGLARARNIGTIATTGDIIVYCDQRIEMEPNAVTELVNNLTPKTWVYGTKGVKKEFVENFSAVYRKEIINAGLFCERIDEYGGMSQEIRARTTEQGIQKQYVGTAKAKQLGVSKNRNAKRGEIIRMKDKLWRMGLK